MTGDRAEYLLQISWVYTRDIEAAARFYGDLIGLPCLRESEDNRLFLTAPTAAIGICREFADRVVEPRGGMISIVTADVNACYERMKANGADIDHPPRRLEQFGIRSFFLHDPDGYVIEIQQFDEDDGLPPLTSPSA